MINYKILILIFVFAFSLEVKVSGFTKFRGSSSSVELLFSVGSRHIRGTQSEIEAAHKSFEKNLKAAQKLIEQLPEAVAIELNKDKTTRKLLFKEESKFSENLEVEHKIKIANTHSGYGLFGAFNFIIKLKKKASEKDSQLIEEIIQRVINRIMIRNHADKS